MSQAPPALLAPKLVAEGKSLHEVMLNELRRRRGFRANPEMSVTKATRTIPCATCDARGLAGRLELRRGPYGLFYGCTSWPVCTMKIGAHQKTGEPLGIPADKATRNARIRAHAVFDRLWKWDAISDPYMTRNQAYRWMQRTMELSVDDAHIGKFTVDQCERLIREVGIYVRSQRRK